MPSRDPIARTSQPRYCLNVLVAHEDAEQYTRLQSVLAASRRVEFNLAWASTIEAVLWAFERNQHDAYLVDERRAAGGPAELYQEADRRGCQAPLIVLRRQGGELAWPQGLRGPDAVLDSGQLEPDAIERCILQAIERTQPARRAADEARAQALLGEADGGVVDEKGLRASQRFLRGALDALSSRIAILDETGRIIAVNEAWRRSAEHGGVGHGATAVGANYVEACQASGECFGQGPLVAAGIRDVMAYRRDEFHLEYPCQAAGRKRWCIVRVTRFRGDGPLRVVVAHENVPERRQAEESLAQLSRQSELILNTIGEGIVGLDPAGRTTFVNPAAAQMIGWNADELAHRPQHTVLHPPAGMAAEGLDQECPVCVALGDGLPRRADNHLFGKRDGGTFRAQYSCRPIREEDRIVGAVLVFAERTALDGPL